MSRIVSLFILLAPAWAQGVPPRAKAFYDATDYRQAIEILKSHEDPESLLLLGKSWFQLGEFKKATETFEKLIAAQPSSDAYLWLGRTWGRRAETASFINAPRYAQRARENFEKAVELNPNNTEAWSDLFEYYLQAPGFLGGGKDKAARAAARLAELNPAEGYWAQARLAEDDKNYGKAEQELRRAIDAAPAHVGRVLDLAKFLARHGRHQESDAEFQRAEKLAPDSPKVVFAKASTLVKSRRNLDEARALLRHYLEMQTSPGDPSKDEARNLLRQAGS